MDLATLLMRVDERRYQMVAAWLADLELIVTATQQVRKALLADSRRPAVSCSCVLMRYISKLGHWVPQ